MATKGKAPKNRRTHTAPKTVLKLPDLDQAKFAVLNSLGSKDAAASRASRASRSSESGWAIG